MVTLPRSLLKMIIKKDDETDLLDRLKEAIQVLYIVALVESSISPLSFMCTPTRTRTHTHTHTPQPKESCKEDESLLSEFLSAISEISQEFEDVDPSPVDLSPLEHDPALETQSIEVQFEQRSAVVLTLTEPAMYVNL